MLEQQNNLLDFLRLSTRFRQWFPMIQFALETGLRFGELSGVTWDNVDMKGNAVCIKQQLIYKNLDGAGCRFCFSDLKTSSGARIIPLTAAAKSALTEQKKLVLMLGRRNSDNLMFCNSLGHPVAANLFNFALNDIADSYNKETPDEPLPHISAHILRHTFCSRLAESGVSPKTMQLLMGHSSADITLSVYTHLSDGAVEKEMLEKFDHAANE